MGVSPPLWKASAALTKKTAPDVAAILELTPPLPQAVLVAEDPFSEAATVEALYDAPPDADFLTRLTGQRIGVTALPDQDWIRLSQEGLPPVRAGRFFVYGIHDAAQVPLGIIPIRIEAGLAFGTGHHETTALCLRALSELARTRRPQRILDLGCGTGVLAIAAAKLWHVPVLAADIDAIAVATARENTRANQVAPLIRAIVADNFAHPLLRAAAPFDLILANILAGPLAILSTGLCRALAKGGVAVLSGLLRDQENQVLSYYRAEGLALNRTLRDGPWSALVLERAQG